MTGSVQSLIFLTIIHNFQSSATVPLEGLKLTSTSECDCSEQTLTYECTVVGGSGGATIWMGDALNCPSDEIVLLHRRFIGTTRTCNNGATVAQSLYVKHNLYTSQLNVTITANVAKESIMCIYDSMSDGPIDNTSQSQFSAQIPGLLPSPNNLYISTANFVSKMLIFTWSPIASDCPTIHYNIIASNCGRCPTTTNHTTATCTDLLTDGSTCVFAIQAVACGNINGNTSNSIRVFTQSDTAQQGSATSISLIAGGIMISIGVLLIFGCLIYELIKRKAICSSLPNRTQQPIQNSTLNSEEVGNTTYSLCDRGSTRLFNNRPRSGQPTWKECTDAQNLGNSMAEYSCLNKHSTDKGNDNPLPRLPKQTSGLNKPQSLYSEDVYDKTSHNSWIMQQQ